jgi:hypothetical protein
MPTISLTNPTALTVIAAGLHSTNYTNIQTLLNGNLDNTNINPAAGISPSKLALGGGTVNYLRADGSWATPPGTYVPVTHPYCILRHSANQNAASGTTTLIYDTEDADAAGMHSGSASTITISETGLWMINASITINGFTNGYNYYEIVSTTLGNVAIAKQSTGVSINASGDTGFNVTRIMDLAAGHGARWDSPVFSAFRLL